LDVISYRPFRESSMEIRKILALTRGLHRSAPFSSPSQIPNANGGIRRPRRALTQRAATRVYHEARELVVAIRTDAGG
jgi:hypothetical protein